MFVWTVCYLNFDIMIFFVGYTLSFLYNNLLLFFLLVYCGEMPLSLQSSDGFSSIIFRQKNEQSYWNRSLAVWYGADTT